MSQILNFVDIETTGGSYNSDQIIEIGILKVIDDKVVDEYNKLIKPTTRIDPWATKIHGITNKMLDNSPYFDELAEEIFEFLENGVVVAHNARFDYSFIKNSFSDLGLEFSKPYACTVKLSRFLYPQHRKHGLSDLINRFGIQVENRHRALDDTKATYEFYSKAKLEADPQIFENAFKKAMHFGAIPSKLIKFDLKNISNNPGVYIFKNEEDIPIYIGKSIHLQDRIKQHFYGSGRSTKEMDIAREVADIEIVETVGEIGALIREALLIKKYKPKYNSVLKKPYSYVLLKFENKKGYFIPRIIETANWRLRTDDSLGFFKSKNEIRNFFEDIKTENGLCENLLTGKSGACFGYHLGICKGACVGKESVASYNERFLETFNESRISHLESGIEQIFMESSLLDKENFRVKDWVLLDSDKGLKNDIETFDYDIYKLLKKFIAS